MTAADSLALGRQAYSRQDWPDVHAHLLAADALGALEADDLYALAVASHLMGENRQSIDYWTRAHHEYLRVSQMEKALRCVFWLAFGLLLTGEPARGSGWLARGHRLLEENPIDCVERGYLSMILGYLQYLQGRPEEALALYDQACSFGERFHDQDLLALCRLGTGEAFASRGEIAGGVALLDEAMTAVTAGDVTPITSALIYCAVLTCCQSIFDVRRAREWTEAFVHWCESQPGITPYQGECLVYRSELTRMRGAWSAAMDEVRRACEMLDRPGAGPWAGDAYYQLAELHRLRGDFEQSDQAYRRADQEGHSPEPGRSLLWLAQGRMDAAVASISRLLAEATSVVSRLRVLPAHVEIMLRAGRIEEARASAEQLTAIAAQHQAPLLAAISGQALGAVLVAEGDAVGALAHLREASAAWNELLAPYEAARVRVLIARACAMLGDHDSAELEVDAARRVFEQLGARPDLAMLDAPFAAPGSGGRGDGLTARELEVLVLLAAGKSNRAISEQLVLSEKTVARHVSNILGKLGLSNRAAATAYAYENGLV